MIKGDIFVDCAHEEIFRGVNAYTLAVAGTYFHNNAITSYYFAKFSTKYNFTEWFIKSENN